MKAFPDVSCWLAGVGNLSAIGTQLDQSAVRAVRESLLTIISWIRRYLRFGRNKSDKKNPAGAGFSLVEWDGDALWGVPSSLLLLRHGVEGGRVEAGACPMADGAGFLTVRQTDVAADDLAALDCVNLTALGHEMPGRR